LPRDASIDRQPAAANHCAMIRAVLWHALMLVWLGFLIRGAWWMWPTFVRLELNEDLVTGSIWLTMGGLLWVLAFLYGRRRYWLRR
jgi:hypothetical protein